MIEDGQEAHAQPGQFASLPDRPPRVITMDSQYCSMGRWISIIVGMSTGLRLLEGRELCAIAGEDWLTPAFLTDFDDRLADRAAADLAADPEFRRVSDALSDAIRRAADAGPCIIHERAAAHVLGYRDDVLNVLVHCSDMEAKFPRAKFDPHFPELANADDASVYDRMDREDRIRSVYHNALSKRPWGHADSYDLTLNTGRISREKCAEILIEAAAPLRLDTDRATGLIKDFTRTWMT